MSKRPAVPRSTKLAVYNRDKSTCRYCLRPFPIGRLEYHHVVPYSKGGGDGESNLVLACRPCNADIGADYREPNEPPEEWPEHHRPLADLRLPRLEPSPDARKLVSIRISDDGYKAVQDYAERHGIVWSEAARLALSRGIRELA